MKKLNERHLRKFESYIHKWQQKLGLHDWEIHVRWLPADHETVSPADARASVDINVQGGIATVNLTQKWESFTSASDSELEFIAFHELCHVFLAKLVRVIESYPLLEGGVRETEEHAVIRKLEFLVLGAKIT
jgi:hypothetical protein